MVVLQLLNLHPWEMFYQLEFSTYAWFLLPSVFRLCSFPEFYRSVPSWVISYICNAVKFFWLLASFAFHPEILWTPKGFLKQCKQIKVHSACHDVLWIWFVHCVLYPPPQHTEEFHFLKQNHLCFTSLSLCPPQSPGDHGSLSCFWVCAFSNMFCEMDSYNMLPFLIGFFHLAIYIPIVTYLVSFYHEKWHGLDLLLFVLSLIGEHLGCFQFGVTMNKSTINIHVQTFFCVDLSFQFNWINTQEHDCWVYGKTMFSLVRNCQTVFLSGGPILRPYLQREFLLLCIFSPAIGITSFFGF